MNSSKTLVAEVFDRETGSQGRKVDRRIFNSRALMSEAFKLFICAYMKDEWALTIQRSDVGERSIIEADYGMCIEICETFKLFNQPSPDWLAARMTSNILFHIGVTLVRFRRRVLHLISAKCPAFAVVEASR